MSETLLQNAERSKAWLEEDLRELNKRIEFLKLHPEVSDYMNMVTNDNERRMIREQEYQNREAIQDRQVLRHIPHEHLSQQ